MCTLQITYPSVDHRHKSKNIRKKSKHSHRQINWIRFQMCFLQGVRDIHYNASTFSHQLSCPWGSPFRFVVPRGRDDLLALDSRLSSCSCLSSNNSDGSSVVVSGHGVRFAGTTISKGGSITHLQKNIFSCG